MKTTVSFILASCSALFLGLSAPSGKAGDAAYPEALGFSTDGARFAFAEWGREDGSGFAYASVYAIDLVRDAWLASPVRVTVEDETAAPRAALTKALAAAGDMMESAGIGAPARQVYARPFHSEAEDEGEVRWARFGALDGRETMAAFRLEVFEIASTCPDQAFGFALIWDGEAIYRDARLSRSRGCPVGYSVERVYVDDQSLRPRFAVALIGIRRRGFEGVDLRHMAVPIPLGGG